MTKPTSISELVDLFGSTQVIVATDDTVRHSCDCWPVGFNGQAQGKPSNRPDVVVTVQADMMGQELKTVLTTYLKPGK